MHALPPAPRAGAGHAVSHVMQQCHSLPGSSTISRRIGGYPAPPPHSPAVAPARMTDRVGGIVRPAGSPCAPGEGDSGSADAGTSPDRRPASAVGLPPGISDPTAPRVWHGLPGAAFRDTCRSRRGFRGGSFFRSCADGVSGPRRRQGSAALPGFAPPCRAWATGTGREAGRERIPRRSSPAAGALARPAFSGGCRDRRACAAACCG